MGSSPNPFRLRLAYDNQQTHCWSLNYRVCKLERQLSFIYGPLTRHILIICRSENNIHLLWPKSKNKTKKTKKRQKKISWIKAMWIKQSWICYQFVVCLPSQANRVPPMWINLISLAHTRPGQEEPTKMTLDRWWVMADGWWANGWARWLGWSWMEWDLLGRSLFMTRLFSCERASERTNRHLAPLGHHSPPFPSAASAASSSSSSSLSQGHTAANLHDGF